MDAIHDILGLFIPPNDNKPNGKPKWFRLRKSIIICVNTLVSALFAAYTLLLCAMLPLVVNKNHLSTPVNVAYFIGCIVLSAIVCACELLGSIGAYKESIKWMKLYLVYAVGRFVVHLFGWFVANSLASAQQNVAWQNAQQNGTQQNGTQQNVTQQNVTQQNGTTQSNGEPQSEYATLLADALYTLSIPILIFYYIYDLKELEEQEKNKNEKKNENENENKEKDKLNDIV